MGNRLGGSGDMPRVSCAGRWGPRRARVTECWAVLTAETVYTALLRDDPSKMKPGTSGELAWSLAGARRSVEWELRPNVVWRFGRLFLRCPECERRATRLYLPREDSSFACRRCWGLTYETRQQWNYRRSSSPLDWFGLSVNEATTRSVRESRRRASAERYEERQQILRSAVYSQP